MTKKADKPLKERYKVEQHGWDMSINEVIDTKTGQAIAAFADDSKALRLVKLLNDKNRIDVC